MATAKQHTGAALVKIEHAAWLLRYFDGRCLNGFGELADPSYAGGALRDVISHLQQAQAELTAAERAGWTKHDD